MGLYTLNVANLINKKREIKIIAIDAHPVNNSRLKENLKSPELRVFAVGTECPKFNNSKLI